MSSNLANLSCGIACA